MRPPQQRRGPVVTHDWVSICGEIARRCIERRRGLKFLVVFPPSACRTYERAGFKLVATKEHDEFGKTTVGETRELDLEQQSWH